LSLSLLRRTECSKQAPCSARAVARRMLKERNSAPPVGRRSSDSVPSVANRCTPSPSSVRSVGHPCTRENSLCQRSAAKARLPQNKHRVQGHVPPQPQNPILYLQKRNAGN